LPPLTRHWTLHNKRLSTRQVSISQPRPQAFNYNGIIKINFKTQVE
jgi:hypothetical protein